MAVFLLLTGCRQYYLVRDCNLDYLIGRSLYQDEDGKFYVGMSWHDAEEVREQDVEQACPK
jgi:hypothetical protein